ncbi:MAG: nitroreductase family protein [Propionibacteriaceae bacterium]|jgi:nitroreductase|nr:nitroreductase family protein [Propionibacteriaceae bacterium]
MSEVFDAMAAMKVRRSIRAFDGRALSEEDAAKLREYVVATRPGFGVTARVEFIQADFGPERVRLGTYGSVKGAKDFLGLVYAEQPFAEEAAACWFEQIVLYCTSLGIATIWLAGFTHSSFDKYVQLADGERVRFACPVGYAGGTKPMIERLGLINTDKIHASKKPIDKLCIGSSFQPLTLADLGEFAEPAQMVRIAPSAKNLQPYLLMVDDGRCRFFHDGSRFARTDAGIAMCHFALAAKATGIEGEFVHEQNVPTPPGYSYSISWVRS